MNFSWFETNQDGHAEFRVSRALWNRRDNVALLSYAVACLEAVCSQDRWGLTQSPPHAPVLLDLKERITRKMLLLSPARVRIPFAAKHRSMARANLIDTVGTKTPTHENIDASIPILGTRVHLLFPPLACSDSSCFNRFYRHSGWLLDR